MRHLSISLVLLLAWAGAAGAQEQQGADAGQPYALADGYTSRVPRSKRIVVIVNNVDPSHTQSTRDQIMRGERISLSGFRDQVAREGGEVQSRSVEWFEDRPSGAVIGAAARWNRWTKLGDDFPVAVLLGFSGLAVPNDPITKRYFRADSTNAQIIHFNVAVDLGDNPAVAWVASTLCSIGTSNQLINTRYLHTPRLTSDDTLGRAAYPYYIAGSAALNQSQQNIKEGVRWFNLSSKPDGDSLVAPGDTLVQGWSVRFKNSGASGKTEPITDYIVNPSGDLANADLLYMRACRYTTLPKVKLYLNMDDVGNWGLSPQFPTTRELNWPPNWRAPRPGLIDTLWRQLITKWGVETWTASGQGDSLRLYMSGSYPGGDFSFFRNYPNVQWIVHPHCIDSTSQYAAPVGRGSANIDSTIPGTPSRRVANRRDPTNSVVAARYGVAQRYQINDSLMKALGLRTSPWVDFPNNTTMGPNFRGAPIGGDAAGFNDDSLWSGWINAGKTHIRGFIGGLDQGNTLGIATYVDDGNAPWRYFTLPDARFMSKGGNAVHSLGVGTITATPQITINLMRDSQSSLQAILGFKTAVWRGTGADPGYINAIAYGEAGNIAQVLYSALRTRGLYCHPKYFTDVPGPADWGGTAYNSGLRGMGDWTWLVVGVLQPINVYAEIAGRRTVQWTLPQHAYGPGEEMRR